MTEAILLEDGHLHAHPEWLLLLAPVTAMYREGWLSPQWAVV